MRTSLATVLNIVDEPEKHTFYVVHPKDSDRSTKVDFYNDGCRLGDEQHFFVCGMEYGPMMVVHCGSLETAYEIWVDEMKPIEASEVHEAYNAYDKLRQRMIDRGEEDTIELRRFCSEWASYYFACATKDGYDEWELDEAYQYQSNSTGTGIVNVGHYAWIEEIDPKQIEIE